MAGTLTTDEGEETGPHECQNGCGRRARIVLVDLDDQSVDLLCGICHLVLLAAVASQVPPPDLSGTLEDAQ
ncbi:MAG TPA: hypothetical protein VIX86_19250, partial [Streptosporangiaceae bacterium]